MSPIAKRLYWQILILLLGAHFIGRPEAMPLALAVGALQSAHALAVRRGFAHLEVQVRVAFLGLLGAGTLPGAWPLHAAQFVGANVLLVADYCLLARLLVLMPWNRRVPFSLALARWVILAPPGGPILAQLAQWRGGGATARAAPRASG